jgi:hypothetical protein
MAPIVVNSFMNIWSALESSRGLTAVAACWRERLGDQFEPFKTAFLQRAHGTPKGMPCPRSCACTHEIICDEGRGSSEEGGRCNELPSARKEFEATSSNSRNTEPVSRSSPSTLYTQPSSTIRAVCRCDPPNCPDIPLTHQDIVLFELSWTKISRALCHVFGLDYKPADLGLLNTRQIGSWSADAVPVILTIQHERAWFRTVLLELIARLRRRFILLAPTAQNLDAVSQELLASSDAAFFSLDANLALDEQNGLRLIGARSPGELFARFAPATSGDEQDIADRVFALIQQLESNSTRNGPSVLAVFRMYCIDGLGRTAISRKCNCTRWTINHRIKSIESKTGMKIDQLRKVSSHFEKAEAKFADSRASHIHRKNLIYDEDDANENQE